jgi:predicted acyltransferase
LATLRLFKSVKWHCQSILASQSANRLLALDVFRGMTITAMILVNNPGSWQYIYGPMKHAQWHGWTLTDLIFPFFIFIVGIAITLSGAKQLEKGLSRSAVLKSAVIRMFKLILLGWFLALFYYNFSAEHYNWIDQRLLTMRFMGVLQRIGLVYFACVLLWLYLSKRMLQITFVVVLVGYWILLMCFPYHDSAGNSYVGLLIFGNNLSAWLDSQLFNSTHLYYKTALPFAFDPEGVLSTFPAIANGLSGIFVGQWLINPKYDTFDKAKWLLLVGVIAAVVGELWGLYFPINKALWTSSYVLLSSGYACVMLASLIYLLDCKNVKNWSAPFVVFGANSIAFFMFAGVVARLLIMLPVADRSLKGWLYTQVFQPVFGELNGSLAFAIGFLVMSYGVMYLMYLRGGDFLESVN